ncbi:MAG: alkyldihydroxyacetonephosphate synthase [Solirubrobacterales bacterium]|nr:alkyldihydroxyacetonephosphate synthase [Solirubrobacterales bacterium]
MTPTSVRRLKHWGWGYEDQHLGGEALVGAAKGIVEHLGFGSADVETPVALEDVELAEPRLAPPASLASIFSDDRYERLSHGLGKAYRDVVRGFRGQFENPPDLVARPESEDDVARILDWCADAGAAAIPFGGGTSVVGGIEPRLGDEYSGAVTIDLRRLDRVLEVDEVSRAARIQAGATGPLLEDQLRESGLTLRHFPQSFEYSTLGGWIATRAGGHFATLYTHIDDLVESVRAITPAGEWESRRLPGSGAGPSPDRALIGSEGILGFITEAWVRLQRRPRWKLSAAAKFDDFAAAAEAVRELSQSGLHPSNCRLLDGAEAALTGASDGRAVLVLGFESAHHPVDASMALALECAADHGGDVAADTSGAKPPAAAGDERSEGDGNGKGDSVGAWRNAFLQAPYLRDTFVAAGVLSETFETAITWDRFESFHAEVMATARLAAAAASGAPIDGPGVPRVSCRFTHVYPDGPAPYFTILAPARRGDEVQQWAEVKVAVSEALIAAGGTITHHHAVGRDHRPWYDRQRPPAFAEALRAAKRALDPAAVLNPGVLIDP